MGIEYYAVNDTKKQVFEIGKLYWAIQTEPDLITAGNDSLKVREVLRGLAEEAKYTWLTEDYLDELSKGLAEMGVERVWNDASGCYDELDDYTVVGSRYSNSPHKIGETVGEFFKRAE